MTAERGRPASPSSRPPPRAHAMLSLEREAHSLASRLPDLTLEAHRVAATVVHGLHGRRRAGPGETFWQFRQFQSSDSAQMIDWRRSASSDHLYIREREWEAAHTVWLWPDLSPSMDFASHLAPVTKRERTIVLVLAAAELLVNGGERVALLGLTHPTASHRAAVRMAEALALNIGLPAATASQPPRVRLGQFSAVVLVSDFLDPLDSTHEHLKSLAGNGVSGYMIQVLDPAEETLPYSGRAEFLAREGGERWLARRVEAVRPEYRRRFEAHRAGLATIAARAGWPFLVHHTDRPASEALLTLLAQMQGGRSNWRAAGTYPNDSLTLQGEEVP